MAVDDINGGGGIKALGGAKVRLVQYDAGDSAEKAKNAAQRMIAQEPDLLRRFRRVAVHFHPGGDRSDRTGGNPVVHPVLFRPDHQPWLPLYLPVFAYRG